jgi:proteasome lid subunit RPN8/RPN11
MISIEPAAEKMMHEDAISTYPDECCGFMYGTEDAGGNRIIIQALPVYNSAAENRKRRFEISAKDYLKAEQHALDNDLQLLGVYHSHPDHPAQPSEHDRVAAQPWFSYVIISVSEYGIKNSRSWVLNEDFRFSEEEFSEQPANTN